MKQSQAADPPDPQDPVEALRRTGKELPRPLRERILALGRAAVAALVRVLEDDELGIEDSKTRRLAAGRQFMRWTASCSIDCRLCRCRQ